MLKKSVTLTPLISSISKNKKKVGSKRKDMQNMPSARLFQKSSMGKNDSSSEVHILFENSTLKTADISLKFIHNFLHIKAFQWRYTSASRLNMGFKCPSLKGVQP
jgi:hypothetical protein